MPARELGEQRWHRPGSGGDGGVEALPLADGRVALRQPADPDGPALVFTRREFAAFLHGVKQGAADFLLEDGPTERVSNRDIAPPVTAGTPTARGCDPDPPQPPSTAARS